MGTCLPGLGWTERDERNAEYLRKKAGVAVRGRALACRTGLRNQIIPSVGREVWGARPSQSLTTMCSSIREVSSGKRRRMGSGKGEAREDLVEMRTYGSMGAVRGVGQTLLQGRNDVPN